jgi:Ca-activated chloride channel family protein
MICNPKIGRQFGTLLRNSEFKQKASYEMSYRIAKNSLGKDMEGYRAEYLKLILDAGRITKKETQI